MHLKDDMKPVGPAVLYAAKSTPDERESIPDQLKEGRDFAARERLSVEAEFSEQKVSAYKGDRGPQLAAALARAEALNATLIVQHSDRLARGDGKQARHLVEIALWAIKTGVRVHCIQDPSTFENLVMAVVMGERNMEDSRRKSTAVKAGHARRKRRGQFPGGPAADGYLRQRNEDDELVPVIDPNRAPIIRRIFAEYVAGQSQLGIARGLAADGVPTVKGGHWYQATIANIIGNPIYAGFLRDPEGGACEGNHEAIIDIQTWEQACALRAAKAGTHRRGRDPIGLHIFRKGFLRCGISGGSMIPRTTRNGSGEMKENYCCIDRLRDPHACSMPNIPRAEVDVPVFSYFEQVALDFDATRDQLAAAVIRKVKEAQALFSAAEAEAQAAASRLARVRRDYASGELTAAEWREFREELEPEAEAAAAEAARLTGQLEKIENDATLAEAEQDVLATLAHIRAAVAGEIADSEGVASIRAVLLRLFDHFVLHPETPSAVHVELIGQRWIEPVISRDAIAAFEQRIMDVPSPMPLEKAKNNSVNSF